MTPAGLPDSIAKLRAALLDGEIGMEEALTAQRQALAADAWHCVAALAAPSPAPEPHLPLAGVGLAHKDIFVAAGRVPHCGAGYPWPKADLPAPAVASLSAAGAAPLAWLAMAEHACGATGENPRFPLPCNPLDARAAVGGSSSGSAVAVTAGLCYASLGTDTAGSVRIPAATCGIIGLKPTQGLLSTVGVAPLAPSLDTVGVLARSVDDARMVFVQMSDSQDEGRSPGTGDWRVSTCWPAAQVDAGVAAALDDFAQECAARGARRDVPLDGLAQWGRLAQTVLYAEAYATHADALRGHAPALGALARTLALTGAAVPPAWVVQAHGQRRACVDVLVREALQDHDVLLTPALPHGVPDWSAVLTDSASFEPGRLLDMFRWFSFVNFLGLPAIVFPIARDAAGRPICVQAIGRPGSEFLLLALARQAECSRFDGHGFCHAFSSSLSQG